MPILGEQPDHNALPPESSPVNRRLATQHVREARDRLTSSSETKPAFEHELLRQYAQNRISASLVILLLVATVGGGTGFGTAAECLDLLGCRGDGGANTFAEILAAVVLAGDLSLMASFCTHEFVGAHERLGRNRPAGHEPVGDDNGAPPVRKPGSEQGS